MCIVQIRSSLNIWENVWSKQYKALNDCEITQQVVSQLIEIDEWLLQKMQQPLNMNQKL